MFAFDTIAVQGSLIQMVNHGISTGALFLLIGMLYERRHTRAMADFGGIAKTVPVLTFFMLFSVFASAGLPGLNGFVGEFMILLGSWNSPTVGNPVLVAVATTGVIFAAVYLLWMVYRTFFGEVTDEANTTMADLNGREIGLLLPLVALMMCSGSGRAVPRAERAGGPLAPRDVELKAAAVADAGPGEVVVVPMAWPDDVALTPPAAPVAPVRRRPASAHSPASPPMSRLASFCPADAARGPRRAAAGAAGARAGRGPRRRLGHRRRGRANGGLVQEPEADEVLARRRRRGRDVAEGGHVALDEGEGAHGDADAHGRAAAGLARRSRSSRSCC